MCAASTRHPAASPPGAQAQDAGRGGRGSLPGGWGGLRGRGPCAASAASTAPGIGGPVGEGRPSCAEDPEPHPALRRGSRGSSRPPAKTLPPRLDVGAAEGPSPRAGGTSCGESWDEPAPGRGCRWCPRLQTPGPELPLPVGAAGPGDPPRRAAHGAPLSPQPPSGPPAP